MMDFGLTNEEKASMLQSNIITLKRELYAALIRLNIDPDGFDAAAWSTPDIVTDHDQVRVTNILNSIELCKQKLEEM